MMHPVFGPALDFTGINNLYADKNQFTVYPNPARNQLMIKLKQGSFETEKLSYSIVDMVGRVIESSNYLNNQTIDISTLSNGIYFLQLTSATKTATQKFVVAK
jgi:hypothetical protein